MDSDVELSDSSSGSGSIDFESEASDLADMNDAVAAGNHPNPTPQRNVSLLAIECVSYFMNYNNLNWEPPLNIEDLRKCVEYEYFSRRIGRALVERCMVPEVLQTVTLTNLDIDQWLEMSDEQAGEQVNQQLTELFFVLPPYRLDQFRHLYVWCFACYLCLRAVQNNRTTFSYQIVDMLISAAYLNTTASEYYFFLHQKAGLYNRIHRLAHDENDEGCLADLEDDNEIDLI